MAKIRKRGNSYQIDYFDPNGKRIRKSFKKRKDVRDWGHPSSFVIYFSMRQV